jgi:flavin reductase (DIM6/NTAB) family NADH-FMN oxidoreductase RutF
MNRETTGKTGRDNYKLLIGSVIPRPVAWVSTMAFDGGLNLAPFSYFQAVCSDPPTVVVSVGRRADGEWKDTAQNAVATGEFVVNIVDMDVAEQMNLTSGDYPFGMSEFELAGVTPAASNVVRPPRVAEAPIALECHLVRTLTLGHDPGQNLLLFGEVASFYVRDDLYDNGRVDAARLRPLGRLAGNQYMKPGELFEMVRPKYEGVAG